MIRKGFVMAVNPGAEMEYERRHRPIWPELEQTLKDHWVHNYSIFLHPETNQLFGYAEIESEEKWAAIAKTLVCPKMVGLYARNHAIKPRLQSHFHRVAGSLSSRISEQKKPRK